jgi:nucleoside-diphosphate-sugar epimerase
MTPLLVADPWFTEVHLWDRKQDGDLLNPRNWDYVLNRVRPQRVLHLAWLRTGTDDYEFAAENLEWARQTINMASACLDRGISVLLLGSAIDSEPWRTTETPYVRAKKQLRAFVGEEAQSSPITLLRPSYIFDEKAGRPRVLRQFYESNQSDKFQLLNPEVKRDYIHIDDVASAVALAARQPKVGAIDIASGVNRSTAALLASSPGVRNLPHPMKNLILDESASDFELSFLYSLGWSPRVTARYFSLVDSEGV